MSGADIYAEVKAGTRTLAETSDKGLADLSCHLARKGKISGTAGRVWGEALAETHVRFVEKFKGAKAKPEASEGTEALTDFVTTDPDAPEA